MYQHAIYVCISWYSKICEKTLMSAKLKGCVTSFVYFLSLLLVRYNCAKFHHFRICVTYFRENRAFLPSPICEQPQNHPSWIEWKPFFLHVKSYIKNNLDFLSKCARENYKEILLVTDDVVNSYTNIPHNFGQEVLGSWLEKLSEGLRSRFKKEFVLECAKFIL